MIPATIRRVAKEEVPALDFPREPVRLTEEHQLLRTRNIARATMLGNLEHTKCRIVFRDSKGINVVETTIWAYDKQHVMLKAGVTIPIDRVIEVDLL